VGVVVGASGWEERTPRTIMPTTVPRSSGESRVRVLDSITAPLGFFVLALLIVETFLGSVLIGAKLEAAAQLIGMWMGVAMFVLVVMLVFLLVWFKPENLTFNREAHLAVRGILLAPTPSPEPGPTKKKRRQATRKPTAKLAGQEGGTS
jgi:hypothetical protein